MDFKHVLRAALLSSAAIAGASQANADHAKTPAYDINAAETILVGVPASRATGAYEQLIENGARPNIQQQSALNELKKTVDQYTVADPSRADILEQANKIGRQEAVEGKWSIESLEYAAADIKTMKLMYTAAKADSIATLEASGLSSKVTESIVGYCLQKVTAEPESYQALTSSFIQDVTSDTKVHDAYKLSNDRFAYVNDRFQKFEPDQYKKLVLEHGTLDRDRKTEAATQEAAAVSYAAANGKAEVFDSIKLPVDAEVKTFAYGTIDKGAYDVLNAVQFATPSVLDSDAPQLPAKELAERIKTSLERINPNALDERSEQHGKLDNSVQNNRQTVELADNRQAVELKDNRQAVELTDNRQAVELKDNRQAVELTDNRQAVELKDNRQAVELTDNRQAVELKDIREAIDLKGHPMQPITISEKGRAAIAAKIEARRAEILGAKQVPQKPKSAAKDGPEL